MTRHTKYFVPCEADNCPRENKNATMLKFLAMILTRTQLKLGGLFFSKKGHTHNALGSLTAIIACLFVLHTALCCHHRGCFGLYPRPNIWNHRNLL